MLGAVLAGGQALLGGIQALTSGNKRRERELNEYAKQSPLYTPNKYINDYYQQSLNRYNENPYQSQQYQIGAKNIQRATAQGLASFQDRKGGIGGAARLAESQISGLQNLGASAEAQRNVRFGQYGQAAQAKAGEDYRAFDINQMTPYNRQLQLKQMAAQAANERFNSGLSMIAQGASNLGQLDIAKQMYPDGVKKDGLGNGLFNFFKNKNTPANNPTAASIPTYPISNSLPSWKGFNLPVWDPATGTYKNK